MGQCPSTGPQFHQKAAAMSTTDDTLESYQEVIKGDEFVKRSEQGTKRVETFSPMEMAALAKFGRENEALRKRKSGALIQIID